MPRLDVVIAPALAVACLAACYAPSPPEGAPCARGDVCPSGLGCYAGVCTRTAGPADASGDGTSVVDAFDAFDAFDAARDAGFDAARDAGFDATLDAAGDAPAGDAPAGDAATCPATYTAVAGQSSKYRAVTTAQTWTAAEQDCENDGVGTHLAVINDMTEDAAVDALTGASIWFGLTDIKVEGTPRWVTGATPTYMNYGSQGNAGNYDCAGIYQSKWAWGDCTTLIHYVCECDGVAADPTAY